MPAQRINIDICQVPSYEKKPMMLINPYGVDMGTSGLIIQAQSREEIYADKLLAFALRPNRIKYRDVWDIIWLHQQGLKPRVEWVPNKLADRHVSPKHFFELFHKREKSLTLDGNLAMEFKKEMQRFLPPEKVKETIDQKELWPFVSNLIGELGGQLQKFIG